MSDAERLTAALIAAGATRAGIIAIVDSYGDAIDWSNHSITDIVAAVWESDANSGDDPDGWIINEICRAYNVPEESE